MQEPYGSVPKHTVPPGPCAFFMCALSGTIEAFAERRRTEAGEDVSLATNRQPLTAPLVSPEMNCFCSSMNNAATGSTETTVAAVRSP